MSEHVSDFIVSRLKAWGVRHIFGYTGDGINGVLGALDRAGNDPPLWRRCGMPPSPLTGLC